MVIGAAIVMNTQEFRGWTSQFGLMLVLALASPAVSGANFYAEGYAGTRNAPELDASNTTGDLTLALPNYLTGSRFAEGEVFVDYGLVRVTARVSAPFGTPSIGDLVASASGTWSDSLTLLAPGEIPGFPGISVIPGMTAGTADLVFRVSGLIEVQAGQNGVSRAGYNVTVMSPAATGGAAIHDFQGLERSGGSASLPVTSVVRMPVSFVYGEAFEVLFRLMTHADTGYEGEADTDYFARALFGDTALWGGMENVTALLPVNGGGTQSVPLPHGSWSATSPTFNYSQPVPEPSSVSLFLIGALASWWLWRQSHRKPKA
jgi:hypothetical protein